MLFADAIFLNLNTLKLNFLLLYIPSQRENFILKNVQNFNQILESSFNLFP